jgi:hypothetical protein
MSWYFASTPLTSEFFGVQDYVRDWSVLPKLVMGEPLPKGFCLKWLKGRTPENQEHIVASGSGWFLSRHAQEILVPALVDSQITVAEIPIGNTTCAFLYAQRGDFLNYAKAQVRRESYVGEDQILGIEKLVFDNRKIRKRLLVSQDWVYNNQFLVHQKLVDFIEQHKLTGLTFESIDIVNKEVDPLLVNYDNMEERFHTFCVEKGLTKRSISETLDTMTRFWLECPSHIERGSGPLRFDSRVGLNEPIHPAQIPLDVMGHAVSDPMNEPSHYVVITRFYRGTPRFDRGELGLSIAHEFIGPVPTDFPILLASTDDFPNMTSEEQAQQLRKQIENSGILTMLNKPSITTQRYGERD